MSRRGNREGTLFRRKDGRWQGAISHAGRRVFVYGKTRAEALEKLRNVQGQIEKGINIKASNYKVAAYLETWLSSKKEMLSENSIYLYASTIERYINPAIGHIKLRELRPDTIQALYAQIEVRGTLQTIHAILHGALKQAVLWDLIPRNPANLVIRPRYPKKEMSFMTQDQVQTLMIYLAGTRWEALYHIALSLGLRRGELVALTWDDVDWKRKTLRIARQAVYVSGRGLFTKTPKTKSSIRTLVLGNTSIEKLKNHKKLQNLERSAIAEWEDYDLIFPNTIGKMYIPSMIGYYHKQIMKDVGIEGIRFHDLRHTAATFMLQQGISPRVVQEILGHSNISMTLGVYAHVTSSMREDAANIMDNLLTPISVDLE